MVTENEINEALMDVKLRVEELDVAVDYGNLDEALDNATSLRDEVETLINLLKQVAS